MMATWWIRYSPHRIEQTCVLLGTTTFHWYQTWDGLWRAFTTWTTALGAREDEEVAV